jgi:hypothetical protein
MQCLLANRTNGAFELTRNLCGRRLLSRQRFKGFHINLAPGATLYSLFRHINSGEIRVRYIMTFPPLCRGLFNVAMRTRFVVAGLSQIEVVATIRQHSVVELVWIGHEMALGSASIQIIP